MAEHEKAETELWVIERRTTTEDKKTLCLSLDGVPCAWNEKEMAERHGRTCVGGEYEVILLPTGAIRQISRDAGNEGSEICIDPPLYSWLHS